ncbi:Uncharacterised protein [Leminorella richardii]|uniref:Uncharacterized protein n=1 Tax=Leminorella richardii TaxID=158841 RepID=A0A2X4XKI6_9GAMM|nr:hypothetical protein [Leminorella richardii]SQI40395.1 Uncharacterised protein [Leminorella richardii]
MDSEDLFRIAIIIGCLALAARGQRFHLRYFLIAIAAIAGLAMLLDYFGLA